MRRRFQLAAVALVGFILLVIPVPARAQSCALCYTQAASAGRRMIEALRSGIIILMIPPACLSVGISVVAYRKRNQFTPDEHEPDEHTINSGNRW